LLKPQTVECSVSGFNVSIFLTVDLPSGSICLVAQSAKSPRDDDVRTSPVGLFPEDRQAFSLKAQS
jgi:hypothetical protein